MSDRSPAFLIRGKSDVAVRSDGSGSTSLHDYTAQHRDRVRILQLLVENEISRLAVWSNPASEIGRSSGPPIGNFEKSVTLVCSARYQVIAS